jgi:hypothetical protein
MATEASVQRACRLLSDLGGLFYFAPGTLEVAAQLGLGPSQFYFLGRGGVLGDVDAGVVDSALGYFATEVVAEYWDGGRAIVAPLEAARAFGRQHLSGDWLGPFCTAASAVLERADPMALPLFAALKSTPLADDLAARAMQLVLELREWRGGVHLLAIVSTGLEPRMAHWLWRPDLWENFGYRPDDVPVVKEGDAERLEEADRLTDRLCLPAFDVLDDSATVHLEEGLHEIERQLPAPEFPDDDE